MSTGARRPVPQPANSGEETADSLKSRPDSFKRMLGDNRILTLNKAAGKMASGDMFEGDIML